MNQSLDGYVDHTASAARVAGLCYIVVIVLGVAQATLVSSGLTMLEDPTAVVAGGAGGLGQESDPGGQTAQRPTLEP